MPKQTNKHAGVTKLEPHGYRVRVYHNGDSFERTLATIAEARHWRSTLLHDLKRCPDGVAYKRQRWHATFVTDSVDEVRDFAELDDAIRWLNNIRLRVDAGTYREHSVAALTLKEFLPQWRSQKARASEATMMRYEVDIRCHILPHLGDARLSVLSRSNVQFWIQQMIDSGTSPSTVDKSVKLLRQILATALAYDIVYKNVALSIDVPRVLRRAQRAVTPEELGAIAEKCREYSPFIQFLARTGLRSGEALALTVDDVDFGEDIVRVNKSFHKKSDHSREIGNTKTRQIRTVPLTPYLRDLLRDIAKAKEAGSWLFAGANGGALSYDWFVKHRFRPAVRSLGLDGEITLHSLRHSFGSHVFASGGSLTSVSKLLGHSSLQMTLNTYIHATDADELHLAMQDWMLSSVSGRSSPPFRERGRNGGTARLATRFDPPKVTRHPDSPVISRSLSIASS